MSFQRNDARGAAPLLTALLRGRRPDAAGARAIAWRDGVRCVLVLKPHDQLGDLLVATPAIGALRARYASARLVLMTRAFLAPIAIRIPGLDEVLVMPRVDGPRGFAEFMDVLSRVAQLAPDLAFVLNSVSRSKTVDALAALSRAACVVGRSRVGTGPPPADAPADPFEAVRRDPVYDVDLEVGAGSDHQTERVLDLVRWTGATADATRLRLEPSPAERRDGRERIERAWSGARGNAIVDPEIPPRWIGLHPGAANPLKMWPLDRFVELGTALARGGSGGEERRLVVFDAPRERGRAAAVHAGLLVAGVDAAFIPAGPLDDFIAGAANLDLLVCNDSGVMHVAAALGVPTVSFHALGRPEEWAPRGPHAAAFHAERIADIELSPALAAAERLLESHRTRA